MVLKGLVADESLNRELERLLNPCGFLCGLIVGQRCSGANNSRDIVVHLAPTPPGNDENDEELEAVERVEDLDVVWMMEHHHQVEKMLCGGLDVLGAFVASDNDVFKSNVGMTHLRKLLKSIGQHQGHNELVILHLDQKSKKMSAKLIDISPDVGQTLKNLDFRTEVFSSKWIKLQGDFLLDCSAAFDKVQTQDQLSEKVAIAMQPLKKSIDSAQILFDNAFRKSAEFLDPKAAAQDSGSKGKKKSNSHNLEEELDNDEETFKQMEIQILLPNDPAGGILSADDVIQTEIESRMKFSGRMKVICFLHPRATVKEAEEAVRCDLLRSLKGRLAMHCDSLVGEEQKGTEEEGAPIMHEPPRRILVELPFSPLSISDYLYPGETPDDSNDSVEEIFGFKPHTEQMDDELELVAAPRDAMASESDESRASSPTFEETQSPKLSSSKFNPAVMVSVLSIVILGAALFYYMFFLTQSQSEDQTEEDGKTEL